MRSGFLSLAGTRSVERRLPDHTLPQIVWPVPALISPFAGVFYPVATLPPWMQAIAHLLPPSYVFEGMRAILAGRPFSSTSLLIGAALALLYIMLAYAFFARVHRRAVRSGLIARYSAETVS